MAMTDTSLPLGAVTIHRAVSVVGTLYGRIARWSELRRTVRLLSELDNEQLDDLGLTRGDILDFARRGRI